MKKYVAISVVNKIKFYLKNNGEWEETYDNLRIYLEDQVGKYFDSTKRKYVLKTSFSQLLVEEFSTENE